MANVYGIDLGTTYSCIAKCNENGDIETLKQLYANDETSLPSVVSFNDDGTPIVGRDAKKRLRNDKYSERTIDNFKREMGKTYCSQKILVGTCKRQISPIEASACVLHELISVIPRKKGEKIPAVIAIPTGYTNHEKQFVKNAAKFAGIEVLGLIQEPTAAAIRSNIQSGETALVFDLGGGTLDVSVVQNEGGKYKVKGFASDKEFLKDKSGVPQNIGGIDWDDALIELACQQMMWSRDDFNKAQLGLFKEYAEDCKMELSKFDNTGTLAVGEITNIKNPTESIPIYNKDFIIRSNVLLEECVTVVNGAIDKADHENGDPIPIDYCVMAGGSSNLKMIKSRLSTALAERIGKDRQEDEWLRSLDHTERAIAEGAALRAYRLINNQDDQIDFVEEKSRYSYGTSIEFRRNGSAERVRLIRNLILSNDEMVFENERPFKFTAENDSITVDVYENGSSAYYNEVVGKGIMKPVKITREGREIIDSNPIEEAQPIHYASIFHETIQVRPKVDESGIKYVDFYVSRDKDGIIKIVVEDSNGRRDPQEVMPNVNENIVNKIKESIKKMDKARGM